MPIIRIQPFSLLAQAHLEAACVLEWNSAKPKKRQSELPVPSPSVNIVFFSAFIRVLNPLARCLLHMRPSGIDRQARRSWSHALVMSETRTRPAFTRAVAWTGWRLI